MAGRQKNSPDQIITGLLGVIDELVEDFYGEDILSSLDQAEIDAAKAYLVGGDDELIELRRVVRAATARIWGVCDHPDLQKFGPLTSDTLGDVTTILRSVVAPEGLNSTPQEVL